MEYNGSCKSFLLFYLDSLSKLLLCKSQDTYNKMKLCYSYNHPKSNSAHAKFVQIENKEKKGKLQK